MVQTMRNEHLIKIFLGMVGGSMALFAWASVLFPEKMPVVWKGGNRAPLSMPSRVTMAVAMTSWCLALAGFHPLICAAVFAVCIMFGFVECSRDRAAYDAARGITEPQRPKPSPQLVWRALCVYDALVFSGFLFGLIRDLRHPPVTEEQHLVHVMAVGGLVFTGLCGLVLYVKRPKKEGPAESKPSQPYLP